MLSLFISAGVRKFVVKEMQAAELVLEPGDEVLQQGPDDTPREQDQEECLQEKQEIEDQQQLVTTTTVEPTLVQSGGKIYYCNRNVVSCNILCLMSFLSFLRSSAGITSDIW